MSELDLNRVGTYKSQITIKETPVKGEDKKPVFIKIDGHSKALKCWPDQLEKYVVAPEAGVTAEAEIDVKERTHSTTGEVIIEAWLKSFGGSPQAKGKGGGGFGGGRGFTPKTTEEIHAASICGCVKSAVDMVIHTETLSEKDLPRIIDVLADGYWRSLAKAGKATAAKAPQEASSTDPKKEAYDYWIGHGGTPATHKEFKEACVAKGIDWVQHVLDGKNFDQSPDQLLRDLTRPAGSGVLEPGGFRNPITHDHNTEEEPETDWYEEFRAISDELRWPGWAEAKVAWESFTKRVLGRTVRDPKYLTQDHYYQMLQFALRVKDGTEDAPAGFAARAKEATHAS